MIKIFYPYRQAGSKWDELRYSFRSLEKHLKEDFEIYLVGDCPDWVNANYTNWDELHEELRGLVHVPYVHDERLSGLGNTNRMMFLFMKEANCTNLNELHESGDLFIRMYDDMYLIGDRTVEDLMVTRIVRPANEVKTMTSGSEAWRRQVLSTAYELIELGYLGYMTESHCPEVFSAAKMRLIYTMFELPGQQLLTSSLYYNVFPYERELIDKKAERALFYGAENEFSYSSVNVAQKCAGKYFLNHNDAGLNEEVKGFIAQQFPNKSRFEK